MPDLAQALAAAPAVKWLIARVSAVTGDTVTITYRGGDVPNVGVLDQYLPVVGDVVHVLASDLNGFLAIGCNNQLVTVPGLPAPGPAVTVTASSVATYRTSTNTWQAGVLQEAPDLTGCWFYSTAARTAASGALPVAKLTIRVIAQDATPVEFMLHQMLTGAGVLMSLPYSYRVAAPPVGVPTDVPLPLEWAALLLQNQAAGVGIGGGDYTGTFTGSSGLLTFTPL